MSVPGSLGELSGLLHLHLSHNELKTLPEGMGRLQGQHRGGGQHHMVVKAAHAQHLFEGSLNSSVLLGQEHFYVHSKKRWQ